jgi:VWFA-related protein
VLSSGFINDSAIQIDNISFERNIPMQSFRFVVPELFASLLTFGLLSFGHAQTPQVTSGQSAPVTTQSSIPKAEETILQANVNLVLVDVVVTNHGNAVHGLGHNSFHIYEDGREQSITSFDEHRSDATLSINPKIAALPPNTFNNTPIYPDSGVVNVLLLDGLNTPVPNQADLHLQMLDYMSKIPPGTSMAIFTLSSQLRMVQGFTTDPAQLVKAFKSSNGKPQATSASDSTTANSADDSMSMGAGGSPALAQHLAEAVANMQQFTADANAFQVDMRVRMTLDAIQQLARYLSAIPGRKNLIWFSGSFPIALDPDDELNNPFSATRNYSDEIRATSKLLSAARVAVYPVDARGIISSPSFDASNRNAGSRQGKQSNTFKNDNKFYQKVSNEESTMGQIAEQTGGQDYVNTNGLKEAVVSAVENGSNYYTLAYVPITKSRDGQYHKIRVSLDNSSAKIAYRRGYYADEQSNSASSDTSKTPTTAHSSSNTGMSTAVLVGAPQTSQILLQARVLPVTDPSLQGAKLPNGPAGELTATLKGPVVRYVIDLNVNTHGLAFESSADGSHKDAIEFVAIAYDADTKRVNFVDKGMQLNLTGDQFAYVTKNGLPIRFAIDLPPGKIALRIAVNEIQGGRIGSIEIPISVVGR